MKISFLSLIVLLLGIFSGVSLAQESIMSDSLALDLEDAPLFEILDYIEKETSFRFVYSNDDIDTKKRYSIQMSKIRISEILDSLFKGKSIRYTIKNDQIILFKKESPDSKEVKHTLKGVVKDAETGETLLGANIRIKGTQKGLATNNYGFYSLTLPAATYSLRFSHVGYRTDEIEVNFDRDRSADITLDDLSDELSEVVVTDNLQNRGDRILGGTSTLKATDIKAVPALLGEPDITRTVLTLSGVTTVAEGTSGFNVRGGNIDQNLVLLDEAPVYNASHALGLFSAFNADVVKDATLYKGAIPSRYGGRGSSVLDIRQREGSLKKFKGEGGIGILFSRLTLEGPIQEDKIGFILSGRRSYFDVLVFPFIDQVEDSKVNFSDGSGKLSFAIDDRNKVYISGYASRDILREPGDSTSEAETDEGLDVSWKNATATLRWNHLFSDKLFMNLSGIFSRYTYALVDDDASLASFGPIGKLDWKSTLQNIIVKPDFVYYSDVDTQWRFGVNAVEYRLAPTLTENTTESFSALDFGLEKGLEISAYGEWKKTWEKFGVNLGLRYSWFARFGPFMVKTYAVDAPKSPVNVTGQEEYDRGEKIIGYDGLEPRISLDYRPDTRNSFKMGFTRNLQYIHLLTNTTASFPYDLWKLSGPFVAPLQVEQLSVGYARQTETENYGLSFEGFYKSFTDQLEFKTGAELLLNPTVETDLLPSKGYAYGTEFGLTKNKGRLTGQLNYTYSVSRRRTVSAFQEENLNEGAYYPSNFDRPHVFNAMVEYDLGKRWDMSTFFTYQSGRPTTRPTGKIVYENLAFLTYGPRNAYRLTPTHRLDLSFRYTPDRAEKKWKSSWSFGVYNAYGRKNVFTEEAGLKGFSNGLLQEDGSVAYTYDDITATNREISFFGAPVPFITYNFTF